MSLNTRYEHDTTTTFISNVRRPNVMFLYLLMSMIMISVPPVLLPCKKMIPMETPDNPAPNVADRNLSAISGVSPK